MIGELARHGYRVSCGTLYPALHALEREGLLRSSEGRRLRMYSITAAGRRQLAAARSALVELAREVLTLRERKQVAARKATRKGVRR